MLQTLSPAECTVQADRLRRTVPDCCAPYARPGSHDTALRPTLASPLFRIQIYAEVDLEMKARALEKCETPETISPTVASEGALMAFLRTLRSEEHTSEL